MRTLLRKNCPRSVWVAGFLLAACSSNQTNGFGGDGGAASSTGLSFNPGSSSSTGGATGASSMTVLTQPDAGTTGSSGTTVTTIYADTDDSLYTLDPMTNVVTLVGKFSGFGSGEGATDVAVDAEGDVYINSESAVYKAVLPSGAGDVVLTGRVAIAPQEQLLLRARLRASGRTRQRRDARGRRQQWRALVHRPDLRRDAGPRQLRPQSLALERHPRALGRHRFLHERGRRADGPRHHPVLRQQRDELHRDGRLPSPAST